VWDSEGLAAALATVNPSVATDESRPHLGGVALTPTAVTATDGHRLHRANVTLPLAEPTADGPSILCRKGALMLAKMSRGMVSLGTSGTSASGKYPARLTATCEAGTLVANIVDAAFPPVDMVIPQRVMTDGCVTLPRKALVEGLKRAAKIGGLASRLDLDYGPTFTVSARDIDTESTVAAAIPVNGHTGRGSLSIGVNPGYVVDFLDSLPRDVTTVDVYYSGELDPLRIDARGATCVVMPMRL
jgi:DNA polymerase III sliding clamp (beta) subunit (PCNA family)